MLGYFKKKREEHERAIALQSLARNMGDALRVELDLFIELEVVPRRKAFLEVFRGQLASIDERLAEFNDGEEVSRLDAAGIDYRLLMENWRERDEERLR